MKMIDVLAKLARDEIKDGTELEVHDLMGHILKYTFYGKSKEFHNERFDGMDRWFSINNSFLNLEVKLIPPKEKKYLVKFNMRGLRNGREYLNYDERDEHVNLNDKCGTSSIQTEFTEDELQSIKPVREFLKDMQGKFGLIEVAENEID